jgi:hypothetical protein
MRLDELNVINVDAIEKYANGLVAHIKFEPAKKWFFNSLRKLLINDEKFNARIAQVSPTAPDWLKQKYKENVPLYRFAPSNDLTQRLDHIVDWLNSVTDVSQEKVEPTQRKSQARQQLVNYAGKILGSLNQIDLKTLISPKQEKAKHHVDDWFDMLNKFVDTPSADADHNVPEEEKTNVVVDYQNKGGWVQLKSQQALEQEGKAMGHCVSSYYGTVKSGATKIFSLRDEENQPHVTMEVRDDTIYQVKGKKNAPPVAKYVPYVKDFLNKLGLPPNQSRYGAHDIEAMGLKYSQETKKYGSVKEVYKTVFTSKNGFEFLLSDDNDRPKYLLWKKDGVYATLSQSYSDSFSLRPQGELEPEAKKEVFAAAVEYLNAHHQKFTLDHAEDFGYVKISKEDPKYYSINEIEPLEKFSGGIEVFKIYDDRSYDYIFAQANDPLKTPILRLNEDGSIHRNTIREEFKEQNPDFDFNKFVSELIVFLNKHVKETSSNSANSLLNDFDIVHDKEKFEKYINAAKVQKQFIDGTKIFLLNGTARLYDKTGTQIIAKWRERTYGGSDSVLGDIEIEDDTFRKYTKEFVEYLNSKKLSPADSHRRYNSVKEKLGQYGITYRGGIWKTAKQKGVDKEVFSGWSIEKIGPKLANILTSDGKRIGSLEFEKGVGVSQVKAFDQPEKLCEFLEEYSRRNPKLQFASDAAGPKLSQYGYTIKDHQFMKIDEAYPTESILKFEGMEWIKTAQVDKEDTPDSYKYGLKDKDGKYVIAVNYSDKTVDNIKIIDNRTEDEEADDNGHDKNKILRYDAVNMAPYVEAFIQLVEKEKLQVKSKILTAGGMQLKGGKIQSVEENPKLKGFVNGEINYDNGAKWKRDRGGNEWELYIPMKRKGREDEEEEKNVEILSCRLDDNGISNVNIDDSIRKNPKVYRPYLNDMLDIIEELNEG